MGKFKKLLFLFLTILSLPLLAWAVTETGTGSNIIAEVSPRDPTPGSMVLISLSGYGFNSEETVYTWSKDGKIKASGRGEKKFSFQLGQLGNPTRIKVSADYGGRRLAEKSFYFEPSDIGFVWEAETMVPPFYQGRARMTAGANLKVASTPYLASQSGQIFKPGDLIYNWYINGVLNKEISGKGKNVISIPTTEKDNQLKISLKVSSIDNKSSANKTLIVYLEKPSIAFYEKLPLEGVNYKKQIIDSYELYSEETSFLAVPFFWPTKLLNDINYSWRVNGVSSPNTDNPNVLTVRQPSGGAGINEINLQVNNGVSTNNSVTGRFNIKFGNNLLKTYNAI